MSCKRFITSYQSLARQVSALVDKARGGAVPLVSLNISTNYFNTVDGYYDMLGRFLHLSATMKVQGCRKSAALSLVLA
jgi:hypothetical protein